MKFCSVVPEICRGQVHVTKKERSRRRIIIRRRNGAKTINLQTLLGRLNKNVSCLNYYTISLKKCQFLDLL